GSMPPPVQAMIPEGHMAGGGSPPPSPPAPVLPPAPNSTHASPQSPPVLFLSPSWTMTCSRDEPPGGSVRFQRASAPKPAFARPLGGTSPSARFQLFFAGSGSGVIDTLLGVTVLSTVRTAPFQVPNTAFGPMGRPPCCQSPARFCGFAVT